VRRSGDATASVRAAAAQTPGQRPLRRSGRRVIASGLTFGHIKALARITSGAGRGCSADVRVPTRDRLSPGLVGDGAPARVVLFAGRGRNLIGSRMIDMVGSPPASSLSSAGGEALSVSSSAPTARERASFEARVDRGDGSGCWTWTAYRESKGYGKAWFRGRCQPAHRVALELAGVVILPGNVATHLCGNRACVRVEHLEQITIGESVLRGSGVCARNAVKVLCSRGHELVARKVARSGSMQRVCLTCVRAMRKLRKPARRHRPVRKRPCAECGVELTTVRLCRSCAQRPRWRDPAYRERMGVVLERARRARANTLVPVAAVGSDVECEPRPHSVDAPTAPV